MFERSAPPPGSVRSSPRPPRPRRWRQPDGTPVGGPLDLAALHLAGFAAQVTLLVREDSLAAGMSDYLITQLQATPNVEVRLDTRVVDGHDKSAWRP